MNDVKLQPHCLQFIGILRGNDGNDVARRVPSSRKVVKFGDRRTRFLLLSECKFVFIIDQRKISTNIKWGGLIIGVNRVQTRIWLQVGFDRL